MNPSKFLVIRGIVRAVLATGLVASTCYAVVFQAEAMSGEGMALLGTLTGAVITHYFQNEEFLKNGNGSENGQ